MTDELMALADRVSHMERSDNAVDVLCEIAMFQPKFDSVAIRANAAGTKVIYTYQSGRESTFWADDWTSDDRRKDTAAALRARAAKEPEA